MLKTLSPVPPGAIADGKTGRPSIDWTRWFNDVQYFVSRMLNAYDGDRAGTATLTAGAVVVGNTRVTSSTKVRMTPQNLGAARGHLGVTLNPGVGFTISSDNAADNRDVFYELVEVF